MGHEKERQIVQDENALAAAEREGRRCAYCGTALLSSEARSRGSCARCEHIVTKDD
jgi:ssDNA-binding Zn-finger/Zn-ribbon topoisomerase 1